MSPVLSFDIQGLLSKHDEIMCCRCVVVHAPTPICLFFFNLNMKLFGNTQLTATFVLFNTDWGKKILVSNCKETFVAFVCKIYAN